MNDILYVFSYMSTLLIIGLVLRSKIKLLQELFLPSSIIFRVYYKSVLERALKIRCL